jgi:PAS domain-containing protein
LDDNEAARQSPFVPFERLPDGSRFEVRYDAARQEWAGTLDVPTASGPITLQAAGSGLFPLLSHLDSPAIFLTNISGFIIAWHPSAERLFGLAPTEVAWVRVGSIFALDGLEPDTMPIRFSRRRRFDFDGWLARRRGEPFWASGFTTPLLDDAGIAVAFAVFTVDGTGRRNGRLLLRHFGGLEGPGTEGLRPFGLTGPMLDWAGAALGTRVHEAER